MAYGPPWDGSAWTWEDFFGPDVAGHMQIFAFPSTTSADTWDLVWEGDASPLASGAPSPSEAAASAVLTAGVLRDVYVYLQRPPPSVGLSTVFFSRETGLAIRSPNAIAP